MPEWLQIVFAVAAGLGVGGWITGIWDRRHASLEAQKAREHATAEAKAARLLAISFDAYQRISVYLERMQLWVNLTEPDTPTGLEPPRIEPDREWIEVGANVGVSASDSVRDALSASKVAVQGFQYALAEWRDSPTIGWDAQDERSPRLKLFEARQRASLAILAAQTAMRDELADL